jgi:hypothetical protein
MAPKSPKMTSGPPPKQAIEAVDKALEAQKQQIAEIQAKMPEYEQKFKDATSRLASLTGTSAPEFVTGATQRFYDTLSQVKSEYEPKMENFQPNVINSESTSSLNNYLAGVGQLYTENLGQVGSDMSNRLYSTLSAPQAAFTASALNPAFENLKNKDYMNFATKPPTVRSDVDSMRQLYTYNV